MVLVMQACAGGFAIVDGKVEIMDTSLPAQANVSVLVSLNVTNSTFGVGAQDAYTHAF